MTATHSGYFENDAKAELASANPEQIQAYLRAALEPQLNGVEISKAVVFHADHATKPLEIYFHVRVPNFAEFTGSRLFVQPAVFRRNVPGVFDAPERQTSIVFPFRHEEFDEITLKMPAGVTLEAGSAPAALKLGNTIGYKASITWSPSSRTLTYERRYEHHAIAIDRSQYAPVREYFETLQQRDNHTLTFLLPPDYDPTAVEPEAETGASRKVSVPLNAPRVLRPKKKK